MGGEGREGHVGGPQRAAWASAGPASTGRPLRQGFNPAGRAASAALTSESNTVTTSSCGSRTDTLPHALSGSRSPYTSTCGGAGRQTGLDTYVESLAAAATADSQPAPVCGAVLPASVCRRWAGPARHQQLADDPTLRPAGACRLCPRGLLQRHESSAPVCHAAAPWHSVPLGGQACRGRPALCGYWPAPPASAPTPAPSACQGRRVSGR